MTRKWTSFQERKFQSLYRDIYWTKARNNRRIARNFSSPTAYTLEGGRPEIFPSLKDYIKEGSSKFLEVTSSKYSSRRGKSLTLVFPTTSPPTYSGIRMPNPNSTNYVTVYVHGAQIAVKNYTNVEKPRTNVWTRNSAYLETCGYN